jgi:predicted Ser/Thr protein kinase
MTAVFEDDRLLVTKEGLAFPLILLPWLGFRRERMWSDLADANVRWEGGTDFAGSDVLSLYFRSGGFARFKLQGVSRADMEQLLLAVEVWGTKCKREPLLIQFQNNLQNQNKGLDHLSYTQMWEEELSRRFHATSFVPLEPGMVLQNGRLKVVRQLAFGGLSAIYLAQRDETEMVVLKEAVVPSNADEVSRDKAVELFEREAQLLITLTHPQIARVLDHFAEDGRNYMLVEYIHGQDMRQLVKQHGPQEELQVLRWAREIAEILDYLHGRSPPIIHRDLTPDNLVLNNDHQVVLIDFGAANEFVGTATGTLVGKQSYISPEQFRCKSVTQSDIYALGGTIYYLLTGHDPEALSQSRPRELSATISESADDLVAQCTAMDLESRFKTAGQVRDAIDLILAEPAASIPQGAA